MSDKAAVQHTGGTITPQEAADLLRVSRSHVYDLLDEGEIPGFRVGRVWRIPRAEFERRFSVTMRCTTEVSMTSQ